MKVRFSSLMIYVLINALFHAGPGFSKNFLPVRFHSSVFCFPAFHPTAYHPTSCSILLHSISVLHLTAFHLTCHRISTHSISPHSISTDNHTFLKLRACHSRPPCLGSSLWLYGYNLQYHTLQNSIDKLEACSQSWLYLRESIVKQAQRGCREFFWFDNWPLAAYFRAWI